MSKEDPWHSKTMALVGASLVSGDERVYHNDDAYQEYVFQVSGGTAESQSGGVVINMIPKEGSNKFGGQFFATGTWPALQANNLDDSLRAGGLRDPTVVERLPSSPPRDADVRTWISRSLVVNSIESPFMQS